jgi:hypothetical protein
MRSWIGAFAQAILPYASLAIAVVSLIVSGVTLQNTTHQQERDFAHRELLLRPWLNFEMNSDNSVKNKRQFWVGVRNDGLGPAVVREVVIESDGQCYNSLATDTEVWGKMYRKELTKVLEANASWFPKIADVANTYGSGEFYKSPDKSKKIRRKVGNELGVTMYQAFDVYGVDKDESLFGIALLADEDVVPAGSSFTMAHVSTERTSEVQTVPRVESTAKAKQKSEPIFEPSTTLTTSPSKTVSTSEPEKINSMGLSIGVGYCSISGKTCDFIRIGTGTCGPTL